MASMSLSAFAISEAPSYVEPNHEDEVTPNATVTTFWESSAERTGTSYGPWRVGPSGMGPATLTLSNVDTYSQGWSGSFGTSINDINFTFEFSIGTTKSCGASYAVSPPANTRRIIIYRSKLADYTVTQKQVRLNLITGERTILQTTHLYTSEFVSWDYSYRVGY